MEFKDYQQKVLETFDKYLDELSGQTARAARIARIAQEQPELNLPVPDAPAEAWRAIKATGVLPAVRGAIDYSPRRDGADRSVPNVCFKVPTGGGKTLLASAAVSRVLGRFLNSNTGFVLWIVPNEAIYTQTKKQLNDREHYYRQVLDRAAAGRVKILEKNDWLDRRDVETHLCVMLLMLQSANRDTAETLRIFKDRGSVHGFFPPPDDIEAHHRLLNEIPNLDAYADQDRANLGSIVKDSLGNVLRFIRPVIVMDEGHRGYSARALRTIYGFNPSFVLELSATPKDRPNDRPPLYANWLVNVRGKDLSDEEMIKLPINIKVKGGDDWRDCLRESFERLNGLQAEASRLEANTARYIRPILLVQVERTGREQREAGFIHADDAKEFLLSLGLDDSEIAIKTSQVNDLKEPENQDLLSPTNRIRVIITKQALQEGWDCPFAYVLCSLSASRNMNAMTQLVGRILRQPHATKVKGNGRPAGGAEESAVSDHPLDQCYVYCLHAQTREVVEGIKRGLEEDGMGDLAQQITEAAGGDNGGGRQTRKIRRRPNFERLEIFLPVVNWVEGDAVRPLDYEHDVLLGLDWSAIKVDELARKIPMDGSHVVASQMTQVTIGAGRGREFATHTPTLKAEEEIELDPVYVTRVITDIVPNAWVARELVGDLMRQLGMRGLDRDRLGSMSSFLLEELRKFLIEERDKLAERQFVADVAAERIQFRLRTDTHNWRVPHELTTDLPETAPQLPRPDGQLTEKSLFAPVYQADYNSDEASFACYLDDHAALDWWHRNVARAGQYHVQGWRKNKVYPDFIFALTRADDVRRMVVMETKGDQLEGNLDTEYKRKLLRLMNDNFQNVVRAGSLELVGDDRTTVSCDLVLMSEWRTEVPLRYFSDVAAGHTDD